MKLDTFEEMNQSQDILKIDFVCCLTSIKSNFAFDAIYQQKILESLVECLIDY